MTAGPKKHAPAVPVPKSAQVDLECRIRAGMGYRTVWATDIRRVEDAILQAADQLGIAPETPFKVTIERTGG